MCCVATTEHIGTRSVRGKSVVLLFTAAGEAAAAMEATAAMVTARTGKVVGRFGYTTMQPNESAKAYTGSNTDRAIAMARDAGRSIVIKSD